MCVPRRPTVGMKGRGDEPDATTRSSGRVHRRGALQHSDPSCRARSTAARRTLCRRQARQGDRSLRRRARGALSAGARQRAVGGVALPAATGHARRERPAQRELEAGRAVERRSGPGVLAALQSVVDAGGPRAGARAALDADHRTLPDLVPDADGAARLRARAATERRAGRRHRLCAAGGAAARHRD